MIIARGYSPSKWIGIFEGHFTEDTSIFINFLLQKLFLQTQLLHLCAFINFHKTKQLGGKLPHSVSYLI